MPAHRTISRESSDATLRARVAATLAAAGVDAGRLVLGLSGGMDSMVLLHLLYRLQSKLSFELSALHVNHQLSPRADEWSALCARRCAHYGVPMREVRVQVRRERGQSPEAAARAARYAVFQEQLADAVVLAHHLDDQAETLLLQLLRGAGPRGLAAMPALRALAGASFRLIVRPLLEVERAALERYARRHRLSWVEDESNFDTDLDRNYLRHQILPRIGARFAGYRQTWLRASRNFAELSEVADDQAATDAAGALQEGGLRLSRLGQLSPARAGNLVRWYLAREGLPYPRREQLEEFLRQLATARSDAKPVLELAGVRLQRHRGLLQIAPVVSAPRQPWQVRWRGEPELTLPGGLGRVRFERVTGVGLATRRLQGMRLSVRSRTGGERLKLAANRPTRTLKNLLREAQVPYWQRDWLPLLACGNDVLWAAEVGVDYRFAAELGEPAILPTWVRC